MIRQIRRAMFTTMMISVGVHSRATLVDAGWSTQTGSNASLTGLSAGAVNASGTNLDTGIFTNFDSNSSSLELVNIGDVVALTGSIFISGSLAGVNSHPGAIRFGLYEVNGSADTTGWHGYFGLLDTTGTAGTSGGIFERNTTNTANFYSGTGATRLTTYDGTQSALVAGTTYNISMTLTKTAAGLQIDAGATNAADGSQVFLSSGVTDATPNTTVFNRVGFYVSASGGGLGAENFNLSGVNVSLAAVPEPMSWGMICAGGMFSAIWVRRSKRRNPVKNRN